MPLSIDSFSGGPEADSSFKSGRKGGKRSSSLRLRGSLDRWGIRRKSGKENKLGIIGYGGSAS